jgi:chemosensory pili system protein ChpA (sensor histidine kinase/response regulator)
MVSARPEVANGLHWLRQELEQSLSRARSGLETFLESPEDKQPLLTALDELRLVRGTVGMIECFGAQLLAEEMSLLLRDLLDEQITHPDEAYAALTGATLQLSDYIDLLAHGEEDRVLVLQPIINELRLARGKPVLTEADLFTRQMQALEAIIPAPVEGAPLDPMGSQAAAKRELPQFQVKFLQWFRGQGAPAALQELAQIASRLAAVSVAARIHDLWAVAAALTESLPTNVSESLDLKRLYGRIGTLMKVHAEQGESGVLPQLGDLTYHLLLFLGRVPNPSERAKALIEQYRLEAFLPAADSLDELRRRLRGPNTMILDRVYEEIRHDFAQIKDAIDLAVRTSGRAQTGFAAIGEKLQRVANTIGMLGLSAPKQALLNQARSLEGLDPNSPAWLDVATAILRVEHALEEALFRALGRNGMRSDRSYAEIEAATPPSQDLREAVSALVRESFVNISLLKTAVDNYLKSGEATTLSQAGTLLREVGAGLIMLDRQRAADLVGQIVEYVRSGALTALTGNLPEAERFADVIACIEVYLEALRDGLPQTERILDDLQGFITKLELREPASALALLAGPLKATEPVVAKPVEAPAVAPASPAAAEAPAQPAVAAPAPAPAPVAPAEEIDPEIREIFIEEASEVLGNLQEQVPTFLSNPSDQSLLSDIRRAFHTLKGSGRMVGAKGIGEFSWAIEQMLNRCLEGALAVKAPVLDTVKSALGLLPDLLQSFRDGVVGAHPDAAPIIERAQALASGRSIADNDMIAVFREDARERLHAVSQWLESIDPSAGSIMVSGDLVRAFHTLRGAAAIVDAAQVAAVSGALESYLGSVQLAERPLPMPALALLADAVMALRTWSEKFGTAEAIRADVAPWLQRIEALQAEISTAAGERRSAVESFTFAALDQVQKVESCLADWQSKPTARPGELVTTLDMLAVAGARAGDASTARVALALAERIKQSPITPSKEYFEQLSMLVEGLYQTIDGFRSGTPTSVEPQLAQIAELPVAPALSADEELRQIFREEAEELMQEVVQATATWRGAPNNAEARDSVRRVLHTMKGSARMAGVGSIGELCQRLEHLVRDFMRENFDRGIGVLETGLAGLRGMFDVFDRGEMPDATPVMNAIDVALGLVPAAAAPAAAPKPEPVVAVVPPEPVVVAPEPEIALEPVVEPPVEMPMPRVVTESVIEPVEEPMPLAAAPEAIELVQESAEHAIHLDPSHLEPIHLEPIGEPVAEPAGELLDPFADESAVTAAMPEPAAEFTAEPEAAPTIAEPEISLEHAFEPEVEVHAVEHHLVEPMAAEPEITLEHFEEPVAPIVLEEPAAEAPVHVELVHEEPVAEPAAPVAEAPIEELPIAAAAEPAVPAVAEPADEERPAPAYEAPAAGSFAVTEPPEPVDAEAEAEAPVAARHYEPSADYEPPLRADAESDAELVEIFSAEATELLEALDTALDTWQNGDEGEAIREIQRTLHTLKGGARMANIHAMGEASHDMETHVNDILMRGEFPDVTAFRAMRRELETLQAMHDRLQRGEPVELAAPAHAAPVEAPVEARASEVEETAEAEAAAPMAAAEREERPRIAAAAAIQHWNPELFWRPDEELVGAGLSRKETARVPVETLDAMLNHAGEISIYRSRLEQQNAGLQTQLNEMSQTVARVREQLRLMDIETDAQIAARGLSAQTVAGGGDRYAQDFDPLEMDRYTRMQELSRALAESINDLASLRASMDEVVSEGDTLLLQQGRINSEVQQGLMSTLMVPFSRQAPRLQRVVRQTATENGKHAEISFTGVDAELDRNVLERMTAPLEHLLRNSVVHGIETPEDRIKRGKRINGEIKIDLHREGTQLVLVVSDDGAGLNYAAIRKKAIERNLMPADAPLADADIARFIFEPGFSTASALTKDAGRGIGMDVVASEVKQLAGTLELTSEPGQGTRFMIRLPLTLAVSQALLVGIGQDAFALPLASIEGIARVPRAQGEDLLKPGAPALDYAGQSYPVRYLGDLVELSRQTASEARALTMILMRIGEGLGTTERRVAIVVDQLIGNREIVSKAVGPQVSSVPGVTGATILPDGRVVLILDVPALVAERSRRALLAEAEAAPVEVVAQGDTREMIMVVDDSVTMRRIAERLLERNGFKVVTAKDGLDAMALLQTETPTTVLLDIEMPRADGFEVAAFIRNTPRLSKIPIIMITSRSGEKHRERARSLGVNRYLIKPYQEDHLMAEVHAVRMKTH